MIIIIGTLVERRYPPGSGAHGAKQKQYINTNLHIIHNLNFTLELEFG